MYETSAGIESELLDLSTVNVATLRAVELTRLDAAIQRVRARIADAGSSISGYSGSFWDEMLETGTRHEDRVG
jgi:hypothetical protein